MLIKGTVNGVLAGICIAIGGSVFLACDIRYIGALLFSVALLTICYFGFSLYTGKIGYIVNRHTKKDVLDTITSILGNFLGCLVFGWLIARAMPNLAEKSGEICAAKFLQSTESVLIRSYFCGILMYIAVWIFREKNSVIGIFTCIPVFILSGFEHSVANMFYITVGGAWGLQAAVYTLFAVIGNSLGGITIPLLEKFSK